MNLKEAFRYQNFLESMIMEGLAYLSNESYIMTRVQKHNRKKANPEAENESVTVVVPGKFDASNEAIVSFVMFVLGEKVCLSNLIEETKNRYSFLIDSELSNNQYRQNIARVLSSMSRKKSSETATKATDYKFDNDGRQSPYTYEMVEVKTIDYPRDLVKELASSLYAEADDISKQADEMKINCEVDFIPTFDVNSCFEEAVYEYVDKKLKI